MHPERPIWLVARLLQTLQTKARQQCYRKTPQAKPPLMISKLNTLMQLTLVGAVIVHYGLTPLPAWLLTGGIYLTALTTVWSGAAYVWRWGRLAWRQGNRRAGSLPHDAS